MIALSAADPVFRKQSLNRLRRIVRTYGQRVLKSRYNESFYIVDLASGFLVWPESLSRYGLGGTFEQLVEFVGGHHR